MSCIAVRPLLSPHCKCCLDVSARLSCCHVAVQVQVTPSTFLHSYSFLLPRCAFIRSFIAKTACWQDLLLLSACGRPLSGGHPPTARSCRKSIKHDLMPPPFAILFARVAAAGRRWWSVPSQWCPAAAGRSAPLSSGQCCSSLRPAWWQ